MKYCRGYGWALAVTIWLMLAAGLVPPALAHCDAMDGPVVRDAQKALDTGNVNYVLKWVKPEYGATVNDAFEKALTARAVNHGEASQAAMSFYDALVRAHRASEGEAYTGLKPAGYGVTPAIRAGDRALEDGSIDRVLALLPEASRPGVIEGYQDAIEKKSHDVNDVNAGREYAEAYIKYIHTVARAEKAAAPPKTGSAQALPEESHFLVSLS